jgi:16S rRNA (cytosine967-C5)-methyltransferase
MAGGSDRSTAKRKYDPVRAEALEAIIQIEQGEQTDNVLQAIFTRKSFRSLDRRFMTQLVNGTTKMRRRLDHEIKFYLAKPSSTLSLRVASILRLGFYQLLFTDRVPAAAAVSESVNLAHHYCDPGKVGLVNAVMRSKVRQPGKVKYVSREEEPARYLADYYSFPDYFVQYCLSEFGVERSEHFLDGLNKPPHVTYRVNFLKAKPDEVAHLLQENDVDFAFGKYLPEFIHISGGGLPLEDELLKTGKVFVQDESAGLAVRLLNPKPGGNVVDLTAAPGGKATYAAIRMRNKGRVTAVDKSRQRLGLLAENIQRLGIKIIAPVACNMTEFQGGPFDRVLLDPPCSGWGTAGKNADLRWAKTPTDIENMVRMQTMMIDRASKLVKPGGVLVYSTCTIIRRENDQIVEEFLLRNRDFEIDPATQFFANELVSDRGFVKTYPDVENLDGSFCARLKREVTN